MKQLIDLSTWDRRDNFNFFRDFLNPTFSITSEVACGGARRKAKEEGRSFFLYYLYAVLRAANEVREFRYRLEKEGVVLYDKVDGLAPIRVNDEGKFVEANIPYHADFEVFYDEAKKIINGLSADENPYGKVTEDREKGEENYGYILLSALPDLHFTSITATQHYRHGDNFPLMNAGKAIVREGELVMPIAMTIHHGFIDGFHVTRFYKIVEALLK